MKREDEFKKALENSIKDGTFLTLGHEGTMDYYLGSIASSLAAIADELHEMNNPEEKKDDHHELMKLKSGILEYIGNREIPLMDREIDKDEVIKIIESIKHKVYSEFYDYVHMVPEEDEE